MNDLNWPYFVLLHLVLNSIDTEIWKKSCHKIRLVKIVIVYARFTLNICSINIFINILKIFTKLLYECKSVNLDLSGGIFLAKPRFVSEVCFIVFRLLCFSFTCCICMDYLYFILKSSESESIWIIWNGLTWDAFVIIIDWYIHTWIKLSENILLIY